MDINQIEAMAIQGLVQAQQLYIAIKQHQGMSEADAEAECDKLSADEHDFVKSELARLGQS